MKKELNKWQKYFDELGIKKNLSSKYIVYIENLIKNNVPIIFELDHLAALLGRSSFFLATAINSTEKFYREFYIPKRKGGKRQISAPYPSLLECQKWIKNNILNKVNIHPTAQAYTDKKSIITNSRIHCGQKYLLKIDLKDFFPSININRVIKIYKDLGYTHRIAFYLSRLCCLHDSLPQGAATSPSLSNIVCLKLDYRLVSFAKYFNLKYTRYADDLAFSGDHIPVKFISYITDIIRSEGFEANNFKTKIISPNHRKILTGISIAENEIKLPKQYKRELRKQIYYIKKFGYFSHVGKLKINNPYYIESLLGKVVFWLSVEPENEYANNSYMFLKELKKGFNFL